MIPQYCVILSFHKIFFNWSTQYFLETGHLAPCSCPKNLKTPPFYRSSLLQKAKLPISFILLDHGQHIGKKLSLIAFQKILQNNLQHQHNFFKKASWNQIHSRIAIRLKLTALIIQFPPHNPMWETLTFLQSYRSVTETIFKLFKKETDFLDFLNVQVLVHSFLNISIYYYGIYPKSKDRYPLLASLGFLVYFTCTYCLNVIQSVYIIETGQRSCLK